MNPSDTPRIVVTGAAWMGGGVGSIETALRRIFAEADQEILVTAYAIGTAADLIFELLDDALARGLEVKLILNRYEGQPMAVRARLAQLTSRYEHLRMYNFTSDEPEDLHAKVVIADRDTGLIGSSNLTRRGLLGNHELAIEVRGAAAAAAAKAIDRLFQSGRVVRV